MNKDNLFVPLMFYGLCWRGLFGFIWTSFVAFAERVKSVKLHLMS